MIIDVHGRYTTAPGALEAWRNRQIAGIMDPSAMPKVSELKIGDDELRESIEANQLAKMKERGIDLTIFSPRARFMALHIGDFNVSPTRATHSHSRRNGNTRPATRRSSNCTTCATILVSRATRCALQRHRAAGRFHSQGRIAGNRRAGIRAVRGLHGSAPDCPVESKHLEVEIPMADSLADAVALVALQQSTGLVAMCGHTRRFNPSHQWVRRKVVASEFAIQRMDVPTYFFRRTNMNAPGQPRSWTDRLLWHHAAHTIDLFQYQTGSKVVKANAIQGPIHPKLGIAMDMSIQPQAANGAICTLRIRSKITASIHARPVQSVVAGAGQRSPPSDAFISPRVLSLPFNNDRPLGTFFRYIGDTGTYLARYDDLFTGREGPIAVSKVDVPMNGIELQDREFIAAIRETREPNGSVAHVLPCYRAMHALEQQLNG